MHIVIMLHEIRLRCDSYRLCSKREMNDVRTEMCNHDKHCVPTFVTRGCKFMRSEYFDGRKYIFFYDIFFIIAAKKNSIFFKIILPNFVSSLILLNSINCQEIVWLGYKTLDVHTEVHRNTADPGGNAWRAEMMQWVSSSSSTTLSPSRIHYTYGCFSRASARA